MAKLSSDQIFAALDQEHRGAIIRVDKIVRHGSGHVVMFSTWYAADGEHITSRAAYIKGESIIWSSLCN
jgi:hypothetical protein